MKNVDRMSERELRQELKVWREFGADVFRRLTVSRYQELRVLENLPSRGKDVADIYAEISGAKRV